MPNLTVYGPVDTMLSAVDNPGIRSAIGLGQTDAPTLGGITIGTGNAKLQYTPGGNLTVSRVSDGGQILVVNADANNLAMGSIMTDTIRNRFTGVNGATLEFLGSGVLEQRNGIGKQTLRIYNTYTSGTVYERAVMDWNGPTPGNLQIGTEFLGSGSGMAARPIDFVTGGVVRMSIAANGTVSGIGFLDVSGQARVTTKYEIFGSLNISSPGDGIMRVANGNSTDFNRLQLGGATSAFPAIKRNGTGIDIVLANDSGFAPVKGKLTTDTNYTAGVPSATGYITIYDATGTAYRVPATV